MAPPGEWPRRSAADDPSTEAGRRAVTAGGHSSDLRGLQHYTPGQPDECWLWRGYVDPRSGYGQFGYRNGKLWAHRMTYEDHVGPIPAKMQIDHLCRNKSCVNPHHMELVTHAENQRRAHLARIGTPRKCGHLYIEGERDCQECNRERARKNRLAARARTLAVPVDSNAGRN